MQETNNIYESVPFEILPEEKAKAKLKKLLEDNKGLFYGARKLAEETGYNSAGTQVQLRKAITELIELDGCPIVATPKGFSWANHPNMLAKYIGSLGERKQGLQRRIDAIEKIYKGQINTKISDHVPESKTAICSVCGEIEECSLYQGRQTCKKCRRMFA